MTNDTDSGVGCLTEAERKSLDSSLLDDGCHGFVGDHPMLYAAVERILSARQETVARVRALAEQWNDTPDYRASEYDEGRVDQRHDMTGQLLIALDGEVSR